MIYQSRLPENPAGGFSFMLPYRIRCTQKPGSGRLCALSARRLRPAFRDRTVFRCFAAARGRTLETHIPAGIFYRGDEYAVRQLISILLDNAVKYSDAGGSISLQLDQARRGVTLQACNACTGMDPAELDRLFDRFYRVEKSRSKQTGGFGVGLSIARSIAEAHKGSIRADCPDPQTIRFTVALK